MCLYLLEAWRTLHTKPSHAVVRLGKSLFPLFALALNIPETFFDDKVRLRYLLDPSNLTKSRTSDTKLGSAYEAVALSTTDWPSG